MAKPTMINPISIMAAFFLPMYCERSPKGNRMSAPAITGTDTIKPFSDGLKPNSSLMNGAMAPFKTQIAKQKSKYKSDVRSVPVWPDFKKSLKFVMIYIPHLEKNYF